MTSRGNQSVSPPAQIPQQRHVNAISSSTPPPQQYYPGPASALSQSAYEYLPQAQGQPFIQYQAYGSALSDARGQPGNSSRGGPPQQNVQQGGNFYQQPGPNIRPQQTQQSHTYFISAQPQGNIRPPRPTHQSTSQMVFIPQNFTPRNNLITIPANMYQGARVPVFQPYVPGTSYPTNIVYYQNGAPGWQGQGMAPTAAATIRPQVREKRVLSIQDPDTGRDITEELLNSRSHSTSAEDHPEDVTAINQNDKEICQTFTRLVADRLKSPDDSNTSGTSSEPHGTVSSAPASTSGSVSASQQYQQPPPQQQVQQPPSIAPTTISTTMMRPPPSVPHHIIPTHPGMVQQPPASAAPSHDLQHQVLNVNLSMPPPQFSLRQPATAMYNAVQQQQHPTHHNPRHPQPPQQQQSVRPQIPPVVAPPPQQAHIQLQSQHQTPQSAHNLPSSTTIESTPFSSKAETSVPDKETPPVEPTSQTNIPAKPAGPPASTPTSAVKPSSPVKEVSTDPLQTVEVLVKPAAVPSSVKTVAASEDVNIDKTENSVKEALHGGGSQVKDGRKGKKGKKDFICKEIGGTDMDAFIDVDGANSGAGENNMTRTNNALDVTAEANSLVASGAQSSSGHSLSNDTEEKQETVSVKDSLSNDQSLINHAPAITGVPLDCGYSRDDSPNPQNNQEQVKPAMTAQRQTEVVETDEKPPLPQSVHKGSLDKTAVQDPKTPPTSIPDTQEAPKPITREPGPLPQPMPTVLTKPAQQPEINVIKTVTTLQKESKSVMEANPITDKAVSTHINKNEYQQTKPEINVEGHPLLGQSVSSKPLENGIPDNEPVSNDLAGDSSVIDQPAIDDEIELPLEPVSEHGDEDMKKGQSHGTNNEVAPTTPPADKVLVRVKRDLKEKLQYDRAYLMELRECASSQTKPDGLPNLEIILDSPVLAASRGSSTAPLDFTPAFFQPSANQRQHAPQIGKTNSRNRPRSDAQIPQRVIKSVSLQDSVKPLHQSEKPWKPSQKQASTGETTDKRRSLESGVLFVMNRLTPTNFERLAGEMKKLNIKTYEDLQELVNIFFDKVTLETKFVEAYANLCKVMSGLKVVPPANSAIKENQATFRVVMLTKCQQEFEADKTMVFEDPEEKRKKIEAEMPDGPERLSQIENTLYQMKLRRLKFYGNIRFIGELFKLSMLTENIMHDCIYRLLKARDDDSLVSLCNLITTVGQALDTDKAKTRMDQYFAQMAKIAEERKSRIKFTLRDAIDLRSNNWVPRKEQTGPKKIDEVHKDFQEEQATKQFLQSQPLPPRSDAQQPNSRRGSRQRQDENKLMMTDDGWNTVGSKSLRIDASKMKLSKSVVDENIQLGPGGGMKQFSMWSRGSFGGIQPSQDNDRTSAPNNRFSALRGEDDHRNYQRSPSRGDGASRSLRQGTTSGHGRGKILARSSQEGERRDALASARSIVGGRSQNSSRENSWNREDRRQFIGPRGSRESENQMTRSDIILRPSADSLMPPPTVSPLPVASTAAGFDDGAVLKKVKPLSEVEMEHKAKTILEEYLSVMDLEEAKLCLRELRGQEHLPLFISASFNEVLERSTKERDLTGLFFHEVVKSGQIPIDVYLKGLAEVLQFAEDMVIDIPMMWTYLAQIIVPMLIRGSLLWSALPTAFKPFLGGKCSAKLVAEILLLAKEKTNEGEVALMWQSNNLSWATFLDADEVDRFLKEKKLEFTVSPVAASTSRVSGYSQVDLQKVADDIEKIVRENGTSSDIFAYIDARFPVGTQDKHFLRALVTGLINVSISANTMKFNEEVIKTHKSVLQRCIKSNPELELQALYAIQALMHKLEHPSGVAATIFDLLYYEDIITEETFKQWEKSTDPQEAEGKGACSMQLTQFFTWLRENEEPETS